MKLKFTTNKDGEKKYTLKSSVSGKTSQDAHYKFIKLKSVKEDLSQESDSE